MKNKKIIQLNKRDNVVTVLEEINPGENIIFSDNRSIEVKEKIPAGFKVAIKDINKGEIIIKYGEAIGMAIKNIQPGEKVHIHNIEGLRGRGDKTNPEDNY